MLVPLHIEIGPAGVTIVGAEGSGLTVIRAVAVRVALIQPAAVLASA